MDISPSPSQTGFRSSRRSFPNLQQLSLAPLSSRFPLDNDNIDADFDDLTPRPSYIQSTTTPTTPSILDRSPSQQRRKENNRRSAHYAHESHIPSFMDPNAPIAKAKSTSALPSQRATDNRTNVASPTPPHTQSRHLPKGKSQLHQPSNDEWLYRAGLAIAEESRLAKGQSWLVSRHSSTSLVATKAAAELYPNPHKAISTSRLPLLATDDATAVDDDANDNPPTPRWPASLSRPTSRNPSRAQSRAQSRRGSKGSRMDMLGMSGFLMQQQQGREGQEGYFDAALGAGPDFVDAEIEAEEEDDRIGDVEEGEDEEVRMLARQRGFGFGGFVDRLVGWTLFNVDEDREESEREDERAEEDPHKVAARRRAEMMRRRELLERTASSSALAAQRESATAAAQEEMSAATGDGDQGGWQDAAWLLSVASKVIL